MQDENAACKLNIHRVMTGRPFSRSCAAISLQQTIESACLYMRKMAMPGTAQVEACAAFAAPWVKICVSDHPQKGLTVIGSPSMPCMIRLKCLAAVVSLQHDLSRCTVGVLQELNTWSLSVCKHWPLPLHLLCTKFSRCTTLQVPQAQGSFPSIWQMTQLHVCDAAAAVTRSEQMYTLCLEGLERYAVELTEAEQQIQAEGAA